MARACGLIGLALVVLAVGLAPRADAQPRPDRIKLGVLNGMFRDTPPALIQAAATPFRDLFKRQTGLDGDVEVCDDCEALASKMKEKRLHFGVFHGFEWAWVRDRYPELRPLVITIPPGKKLYASLVVHKTSKAATPADLTDTDVAIPLGTKAHCYLFIDRLRENLPATCCRPIKRPDTGPDELLDGVVTGKVPAALVDAAVLTAYQNNKPGPATQIKVLTQSDPFPPTVLVYRKDGVDPATVEKIRFGLVKANTTAQGRAFLMLWQLKGFEDIPAWYEADLKRVREAYPPPAK